MSIRTVAVFTAAAWCLICGFSKENFAQTYGVDLHNLAQPASGGMAGVSLARPQDAPSALFGNPSTMSQFEGTVVTTGLNWLQPTVYATHDGTVTTPLGGGPFNAKSETQGFLTPSVAVLQDLRSIGVPGTAGVGLTTSSGLGTSFRHVPQSLGATAEYWVFNINGGAGIDITDNLSAGAAFTLGVGVLDAGFVTNSAATHAYAPRGNFGFDYDLPMESTAAVYYQTKMPFVFNNLTTPSTGLFSDVRIDQPDNIGFGLSNQSLMCGNLLVGVDIIYKNWKNAAFWRDYYTNQWVYALGAQYTQGNWKYRAGYAYANNPIDLSAGSAGGIASQALSNYLQATELAAISKHRLTVGLGYANILPGLDFDMYGGGLLQESSDFGPFSSAKAYAWYAGFGLTWRFCPPCATE